MVQNSPSHLIVSVSGPLVSSPPPLLSSSGPAAAVLKRGKKKKQTRKKSLNWASHSPNLGSFEQVSEVVITVPAVPLCLTHGPFESGLVQSGTMGSGFTQSSGSEGGVGCWGGGGKEKWST